MNSSAIGWAICSANCWRRLRWITSSPPRSPPTSSAIRSAGIGDAGGAHRRLDRRQDMALHDAQQDVVARDVEALAELLLGEQRHRRAGALEAVVVDDQVGGAAADIDAGDRRACRRPACRAACRRPGRSGGRRRRNCARPRCRDRRAGCSSPRPSRSARAAPARPASSSFQPIIIHTRSRAASARLRKIRRSASGMPVGRVSTMRRSRRGVSAWARRPRCCGEFIRVSACSSTSVSTKVMIEERE